MYGGRAGDLYAYLGDGDGGAAEQGTLQLVTVHVQPVGVLEDRYHRADHGIVRHVGLQLPQRVTEGRPLVLPACIRGIRI